MDELPQETLDPEDWDAFREDAQRILDDTIRYLEQRRDEPVWDRMDDAVRARFTGPAPREGAPLAEVYADFAAHVRPHLLGNNHARFWGWVNGNGTPVAMLADLLAASIDPNCAMADQAPRDVEFQVLRWLADSLGLPEGSSGLLVSGGSEANLIGLAAARQRFDPTVKAQGVDPARADLVFYGSEQSHFSLWKALEVMGLGSERYRRIPTDEAHRVDVAAMAAAIAEDRAAGRTPAGIVAMLGTVNTGAVDPVDELADLAEREGLWLHVDGAFGALLAWSPEQRHLAAGIERADSVAFDLHKWAYQPYEVACTLVRDPSLLEDAFGFAAPYLDVEPGGILDTDAGFSNRGIQLSRGFKALKVWFTIRTEGMDKLGRMIAQNCAQAAWLTAQVEAHPALELLAPTATCIVNFRLHPPGVDDEAELDALNQRLMSHLHHGGLAMPSPTRVQGRYSVRVAFTNHRTVTADLQRFVEEVVTFGAPPE